MRIRYEYVTGEIVEIEVDGTIAEALSVLQRETENNERAETRRHDSIDYLTQCGVQFSSGVDVSFSAAQNMDIEKLHLALATLRPEQRRVIQKVYFEGQSISDVAREMGITKQSLHERIQHAKKRIVKFMNNP